MPVFELNSQPYETDADGFLQDPNQWNKGIAEYLANGCGITLTLEHWNIIGIIRNYYQEYGYPPQMKIIVREMKKCWVKKRVMRGIFTSFFLRGSIIRHLRSPGFLHLFPAVVVEACLLA
ncbi:hypothetical protein AUJ95_06400 [Candidatus Desantisbacteria bacterium CG2_30_40_21]|uniref:Sulfurtransferase TusE n=4 Tax=unclassified Candidatus Desantisiibacteriota TaxID=3106372 RepID=A0A2M7J8P9_9BACT|nr:MAG: hypothetical protein AUJ95_06400 [Candidatus Desantisbacteria bacterium CG2_30_40_21]PIP40327.1 MAG: hypothetical protein COX18_07090 [Candidatus Desantisbacteria bacterium CG23_combo_of_CG06-09_8_20_14_all_40_23]PIX15762.1 MAG: hypothetical protein COZ71_09510 [Candidatus Desantisbacteria bacterium CG_4_8_14_3_um_filter_40_12]PIY19609.1 MAG: hypothetical protein COZ13_04490 [Candidatus Desantisbacteria bacterium CG_4_10_14_3_um_filter_40_18]